MRARRFILRSLSHVGAYALLGACGGGSGGTLAPPSNTQVAALSIDTPHSSAAFDQAALDDAVDLAQSAGVRGVLVTYPWSSLESAPGLVDVSHLRGELDYYHRRGLQIFLGIQVINTAKREVPADLDNVDFDDPRFIARFHSLLDAVRSVLSGSERYISIGNEVDVYLQAHAQEWPRYVAFFADAAGYVHQVAANAQVGATTTFGGYAVESRADVRALNAYSDVVMLTYYPLQDGSQVREASAPAEDVPIMLSLADSKPVILQEAGYPSGALNGSSEAAQRDFVDALFDAWHAAGPRMPFLSFFLLYDFDQTTCDELEAYYGVTDAAFSSYLCTLGLRRSDGSEKPAWSAFATAVQ